MTHPQDIDYIPSDSNHTNATAYDRRYSKATAYDGVGYISVQYPAGLNQDVRAQTEDVLAKLDSYIERLGSDRSRILKVNLFLTDVRDLSVINEVWDAWIVPGRPPARTPVLGPLLRPEVLVAAEAVVAITPQADRA
jgi:enamine deaminase RidA (YjgF/YER057c/UK114 family)